MFLMIIPQLVETFFFLDKESDINPYYNQYKSHQFDLEIQNNEFALTLSKYGLIEIKTSTHKIKL